MNTSALSTREQLMANCHKLIKAEKEEGMEAKSKEGRCLFGLTAGRNHGGMCEHGFVVRRKEEEWNNLPAVTDTQPYSFSRLPTARCGHVTALSQTGCHRCTQARGTKGVPSCPSPSLAALLPAMKATVPEASWTVI